MAKKNGIDLADEDMSLYTDDVGGGLEDVSAQDLQIPFLTILQPLSPQVNKRNSEYVDGAEPGMIYNTATQVLYAEHLDFIPCKYQRRHTEWKPRETGGGLVRDWGSDDSRLNECTRDDRGRDVTPDGNVVVTSGTFYGLIYPSGERAVLAMSSTQFKKARRWLAAALGEKMPHPDDPNKMIQLSLYANVYRLTTVTEKNEQGEWFGWKITKLDRTQKLEGGKQLYLEARDMKNDVQEERLQLASPPVSHDDPNRDQEVPF